MKGQTHLKIWAPLRALRYIPWPRQGDATTISGASICKQDYLRMLNPFALEI